MGSPGVDRLVPQCPLLPWGNKGLHEVCANRVTSPDEWSIVRLLSPLNSLVMRDGGTPMHCVSSERLMPSRFKNCSNSSTMWSMRISTCDSMFAMDFANASASVLRPFVMLMEDFTYM